METVTPGCRLVARKRADMAAEDRAELERLHIDRSTIVYATYVDVHGLSLYAIRHDRADIQGYVPNTGFWNWRSFFEAGALPGDGARNPAYAMTKHFATVFPTDCV
jgi:hypothetical protein